MQHLILFAHPKEAEATLQALQARPCPGSERALWNTGIMPTCYAFKQGHVVISNLGLHAAAATLAQYLPQHQVVWNIGFAGSLQPNLSLFDLVSVASVSKLIPYPLDHYATSMVQQTLPVLQIHPTGIHLLSSDFPIHQTPLRQSLAQKHYQAVDMEGYAIAYMAQHFKVPCRLWKIISDFASEQGPELIRQQATKLSEKIAEHLTQCLS